MICEILRPAATSVTRTCAAGDLRDQSVFCFVHPEVYSETFSSQLPLAGPDLIDVIEAVGVIEDQIDSDEAASAIANPANRPTSSRAGAAA